MAISDTEVSHIVKLINMEYPGFTMLIGSCFIELLSWRLPRQCSHWLAMTVVIGSQPDQSNNLLNWNLAKSYSLHQRAPSDEGSEAIWIIACRGQAHKRLMCHRR